MYTYGWFMLRFDRKQKNSVMQLSSIKNKLIKKKAKTYHLGPLLVILIFMTWGREWEHSRDGVGKRGETENESKAHVKC